MGSEGSEVGISAHAGPSRSRNGRTHQNQRCLSSPMSKYPLYCWTVVSQSLGSVTRSL